MRTFIACVVTAMVAVVATASAAGVLTLRPGEDLMIQGYPYTCQSTSMTPNFSCSYNALDRPARTPIISTYGKRRVEVQSQARPRIKLSGGVYTTTFSR
ncbi:MAG TPA: hypothetical protein VNZ62_03900 [Capillimicrobium sp.]|nr:hypothetical protein [Capillimicrobium sp.]